MQFAECGNKQVRYFRKRTYEDIPWKTVFEGSLVKCKKCLSQIRAKVLRQNSDMNVKLPKTKAPRLSFLDEISDWSIKIGIQAKELANDPTWCCGHTPDETYFVEAELEEVGVRDIIDGIEDKSKSDQPSCDWSVVEEIFQL